MRAEAKRTAAEVRLWLIVMIRQDGYATGASPVQSVTAVSYTHLDDDARLPFDVYESGQGVPDQGLSGPAGFPDFQGHSDRQPVESG